MVFQQTIFWTDEMDAKLVQMRLDRHTWQEISDALELGMETVRERGRRINAQRRPLPPLEPVELSGNVNGRPPFPPGHPVSWSLLIAGTVLDGMVYPMPVYIHGAGQ